MSKLSRPVRFGVLGAARIAPKALMIPASQGPEAEVTALAARDERRARSFAARWGIPRVYPDYATLVQDREIDAIYIPLPMSLHAEWTLRALREGKHVLCEKPFAANAEEARVMVDTAAELGLVLAEAFHYYYHPLFARVLQLVRGGLLGHLKRVEGRFVVAITDPGDLRLHYSTAGGATMDLGCYPLHWLRQVVGEEPSVIQAEATTGNPGVDVSMTARLTFPSGAAGLMHCSMAEDSAFANSLLIEGALGSLRVENPLAPQLGHDLAITVEGQTTHEHLDADPTYRHQLVAFANAVRTGKPLPTSGEDSVATMQLIDAVYRAAGLPKRGLTQPLFL